MAQKNLSFTALIPEHHTCTDEDGTVYEFRSRKDFTTHDVVKSQQLLAHTNAALRSLNNKKTDGVD